MPETIPLSWQAECGETGRADAAVIVPTVFRERAHAAPRNGWIATSVLAKSGKAITLREPIGRAVRSDQQLILL